MLFARRVTGMLQISRSLVTAMPSRAASEWASARWSNLVRAQSKVTTIDDPPTAPLPEENEVEGKADFSNFLDKNADVSLNQAVFSLGAMLFGLYGAYRLATRKAKSTEPLFVTREFPTIEQSLPQYHAKRDHPTP
jgi:VanZ family protein